MFVHISVINKEKLKVPLGFAVQRGMSVVPPRADIRYLLDHLIDGRSVG